MDDEKMYRRLDRLTAKVMRAGGGWSVGELPQNVRDVLHLYSEIAEKLGAKQANIKGDIEEWAEREAVNGVLHGFYGATVEFYPHGIRIWHPCFWEWMGGWGKAAPGEGESLGIGLDWKQAAKKVLSDCELDTYPRRSAQGIAAGLRSLAEAIEKGAAKLPEEAGD